MYVNCDGLTRGKMAANEQTVRTSSRTSPTAKVM